MKVKNVFVVSSVRILHLINAILKVIFLLIQAKSHMHVATAKCHFDKSSYCVVILIFTMFQDMFHLLLVVR
jgi:hypothetical protein